MFLSLGSTMEIFAQKVFTLEGTVDPEITDSCYNIYLADENFRIQDQSPIACVPVVGKKFHYEIPLEKVTSARIRCIFPGNKLCSKWIDMFFVPGETAALTVHNGYYNLERKQSYSSKVERDIWNVRNSTNWKTPNIPKLKGKMWNNPSQNEYYRFAMYVKDVCFTDTATILHIASDRVYENVVIGKDDYLQDDKGNKYKLKNALLGEIGENVCNEARVFGGYYSFEPLPKGIKSFTYHNSRGFDIKEICEAPKVKCQKPNFTINVYATEGIDDSGYVLMMYDKCGHMAYQVADITLDKDRKATYSMYLDEDREGYLAATFPDGSICPYVVDFPFIKGETINLKVKNGTFEVDGSNFYEQWRKASELEYNAEKFQKPGETQEVLRKGLIKHGHERGFVSCYVRSGELPLDTIISLLPESMLETEYGKKLQTKALEEKLLREEMERRAAEKEKLLKETQTLPGMMFKDFSVEYDGKVQKLSDYVGKGKYVLADFWASWCGPCRAEIPNIIKVWNKYKGDKFEVLGIATWDDPKDTFKAMEELKIEYPQIINAQKIGSDAYGVMGIPEIILFAPDGTIVARGLRGEGIEAAVKKCFEQE